MKRERLAEDLAGTIIAREGFGEGEASKAQMKRLPFTRKQNKSKEAGNVSDTC